MFEQQREKFKELSRETGRILSRIPIGPNGLTILSIFFVLFSFYFLINYNFAFATIFFLLSGILDFADGAVAKYSQKETKTGAYLDTICDRYVEGIILFAFLFLPLPKILLSPACWIFLALFGSLMTTYSKAAAKEKALVKKEFKKGFWGRAERVILILISIFLGNFNFSLMLYPLIISAVLSNLSALQRIYLILHQETIHQDKFSKI